VKALQQGLLAELRGHGYTGSSAIASNAPRARLRWLRGHGYTGDSAVADHAPRARLRGRLGWKGLWARLCGQAPRPAELKRRPFKYFKEEVRPLAVAQARRLRRFRGQLRGTVCRQALQTPCGQRAWLRWQLRRRGFAGWPCGQGSAGWPCKVPATHVIGQDATVDRSMQVAARRREPRTRAEQHAAS
jgi:hypothetical protein